MKRRILTLFLSIMMTVSVLPVSASANFEFIDMPDDWSKPALERAIENGLLNGDHNKILPKNNLTRAQMATIINRAFGTTEKASLNSYSDVLSSAWYYEEMAKAVQMQTFLGNNGKLNPENNITREEAFVVLARALKLSGASETVLNKFSDEKNVSNWAKDEVASLVAAGYVAGSDGKLNPKASITRAEFAQLMDNILKHYVKSSGTYNNDLNGNVMINCPDVILKDMTITGDLIIGDGVGDGDITLDNVNVTGRTVIRGGGVNSIKIVGKSNIKNIIVARVDGEVRVYTEDGTKVGEVTIDGNDDVIVEGEFENIIIIASDIKVIAKDAQIESITVDATNDEIEVLKGSKIEDVLISSDRVNISGKGKVGTVAANANNIKVTIIGAAVTAGSETTGVTAGTKTVQAGSSKTVGRKGTSKINNRPFVQAARVASFSALYEGIARQPEMYNELIATAKELTGEVGEKSSTKVQAARVASFSALYEGIARHPETYDYLIAAAKVLTGEAGDMSSVEVQAARVASFSALYEAIARQPDMYNELIATAKDLTGEAGDMSSVEVQVARAASFSALYEGIGRNPEVSDGLIAAAKELTGEAGDMSSVEVQVARVASFYALYEAIARNPEVSDRLIAAAKELTGEAGDMSSVEVQVARAASFYALYEGIARNPEVSDRLIAAAKELTGEAGDMSSVEVQVARAASFYALYEGIARNPEVSDRLLAAAKELTGEAGDMSSVEVQVARAASFYALYEGIARQPEASDRIIAAAKELTGEAGNMLLPVSNIEKTIKDFRFENIQSSVISTINEEKKIIELIVPVDTDVTSMIPTFTNSEETTVTVNGLLQTSGKTTNNFAKPLKYIVTAKDESTVTYKVKVLFSSSDNKTIFTMEDGKITGYLGSNSDLLIPKTIGGITVTSIGNYVFNGCTALTSVTIPDCVESIGKSAFAYCNNLTSMTILADELTIGNRAFIDETITNKLIEVYGEGGAGTYCYDGDNWAKENDISIKSIVGVTAPVVGETPVLSIEDTAEYTATIEWNGNPTEFVSDTPYTAIITVIPKEGYTLYGVPENFFRVAGAATRNDAGSGVIMVVFSSAKESSIIDDIAFVEAFAVADGLDENRAKLIFADGMKKIVTISTVEYYDIDEATPENGWIKVEGVNINQTVADTIEDNMVFFTEKDDEYSIKQIGADNHDGYENFSSDATTVTEATSDKDGVLDVNGSIYTIADDAVVFLNENGDYSVITGAILKNLSADVTGQSTVLSNETNDVSIAEVVILSINTDLPNERILKDNYSYVTDCFEGTFEGNNTKIIQVWNDEFGIIYLYEVGGGSQYNDGDILVYDLLDYNKVENVEVVTKNNITGATVAEVGAITRVGNDDKGDFIDFTGSTTATDRYYFTDNTQYIFCDTQENEEFEDVGDISVADESSTGMIDNAFVLADSNKKVLLIVVDINNDYFNN